MKTNKKILELFLLIKKLFDKQSKLNISYARINSQQNSINKLQRQLLENILREIKKIWLVMLIAFLIAIFIKQINNIFVFFINLPLIYFIEVSRLYKQASVDGKLNLLVIPLTIVLTLFGQKLISSMRRKKN